MSYQVNLIPVSFEYVSNQSSVSEKNVNKTSKFFKTFVELNSKECETFNVSLVGLHNREFYYAEKTVSKKKK